MEQLIQTIDALGFGVALWRGMHGWVGAITQYPAQNKLAVMLDPQPSPYFVLEKLRDLAHEYVDMEARESCSKGV